jgi:hypothetical protein
MVRREAYRNTNVLIARKTFPPKENLKDYSLKNTSINDKHSTI